MTTDPYTLAALAVITVAAAGLWWRGAKAVRERDELTAIINSMTREQERQAERWKSALDAARKDVKALEYQGATLKKNSTWPASALDSKAYQEEQDAKNRWARTFVEELPTHTPHPWSDEARASAALAEEEDAEKEAAWDASISATIEKFLQERDAALAALAHEKAYVERREGLIAEMGGAIEKLPYTPPEGEIPDPPKDLPDLPWRHVAARRAWMADIVGDTPDRSGATVRMYEIRRRQGNWVGFQCERLGAHTIESHPALENVMRACARDAYYAGYWDGEAWRTEL